MLYRPDKLNKPTLRERLYPAAKDWARTLVAVALIAAAVNFFFPRYAVEGQSMEPQLHETDRLLGSHIDVMTGSLERGEVVTLYSPRDGTLVVKRLIGLPGETVEISAGTVYINGEPLSEPYINEPPNYSGTWQLGSRQYFVLGDNRNHSLDSHLYGPVDAGLLQGVIHFRWWPPDAFSAFPIPTYTNLR